MPQVECTFLNKITWSVLFGSAFEKNGDLENERTKRKTHFNFTKRCIFKNRVIANYILKSLLFQTASFKIVVRNEH